MILDLGIENKNMVNKGREIELDKEISEAIKRYHGDLTYAQVVGVLQIQIHDLLRNFYVDEEE